MSWLKDKLNKQWNKAVNKKTEFYGRAMAAGLELGAVSCCAAADAHRWLIGEIEEHPKQWEATKTEAFIRLAKICTEWVAFKDFKPTQLSGDAAKLLVSRSFELAAADLIEVSRRGTEIPKTAIDRFVDACIYFGHSARANPGMLGVDING